MVVAFFRLPNGAVHSLEVHAGQVVEVKNIPAMDLLTPSVEQLSNMTKPQLENMTSEYGIDIPKKSTKLQIIEALRNDWQSRVMPTLRLRPTLLGFLEGGCNSDDDDNSESEAELPSGSGEKIVEEDEVEVIPIDEMTLGSGSLRTLVQVPLKKTVKTFFFYHEPHSTSADLLECLSASNDGAINPKKCHCQGHWRSVRSSSLRDNRKPSCSGWIVCSTKASGWRTFP